MRHKSSWLECLTPDREWNDAGRRGAGGRSELERGLSRESLKVKDERQSEKGRHISLILSIRTQ
jgi:hypothetical protein